MKLFKNNLRIIIVTLMLTLFYLSVFYIDLNTFTDIIPTAYCEGGDDSSNTSANTSDTNQLNNTLNEFGNLANNGITHNHTISMDNSTSTIFNKIANGLNGSISVYAGSQAASYITHPFGKVAVFLGTFGVTYGLQQTFMPKIGDNKLFSASNSSNINSSNVSKSSTEPLKVLSTTQSQESTNSNTVANSMYESEHWDFFINSVIETTDAFDQTLTGMIILASTGLYVLTAFGLGILSRELRLEEKDWVKSRPILLKLATLGKHSSRLVLFALYLLTYLSLLGLLFGLINIKLQFPN